jgi:predicted RNA binding protein YcfA (HicA-like mRNA interferase family)
LKAISGKDFIRLLKKKGWNHNRTNGSHHIYIKENTPLRISVPVHGNTPLKIGLLKHFMKIAEIDESEL